MIAINVPFILRIIFKVCVFQLRESQSQLATLSHVVITRTRSTWSDYVVILAHRAVVINL